MALSERDAHEWLCTQLAPLRARAREGGWEDKLERTVRTVQDGGSAVRACRLLGYRGHAESVRGTFSGGIPLARLGLDPLVRRGEYVCPKSNCGRRAGVRPDGGEPRCTLYGSVMDLQPLDEPS
ncbi:hypothetical protein [Micromonospora sp. NPDC049891]|uniref:hypothetical protein n=1 Tax=Micromonospora sp. NPDC049891 TaxID=3155655 RepID=UPI0033D7BA38